MSVFDEGFTLSILLLDFFFKKMATTSHSLSSKTAAQEHPHSLLYGQMHFGLSHTLFVLPQTLASISSVKGKPTRTSCLFQPEPESVFTRASSRFESSAHLVINGH